jgi:ankyrin repeat protein
MTRYAFLARPRTLVAAVALALAPTLALAGPLHDAARAGDEMLIQKLLDGGASIDDLDETGETPLISAALAGQTTTVDLLLRRQADAKLRNDRGMTVLHAAAFAGDDTAVAELIGGGAAKAAIDINDHENKFGVTPLIAAAEENHPGVVAYLILAGADLEITERHGYTALSRAGYHGNNEVIALLLKAGAACQEADPFWLKDCTARKAALGL